MSPLHAPLQSPQATTDEFQPTHREKVDRQRAAQATQQLARVLHLCRVDTCDASIASHQVTRKAIPLLHKNDGVVSEPKNTRLISHLKGSRRILAGILSARTAHAIVYISEAIYLSDETFSTGYVKKFHNDIETHVRRSLGRRADIRILVQPGIGLADDEVVAYAGPAIHLSDTPPTHDVTLAFQTAQGPHAPVTPTFYPADDEAEGRPMGLHAGQTHLFIGGTDSTAPMRLECFPWPGAHLVINFTNPRRPRAIGDGVRLRAASINLEEEPDGSWLGFIERVADPMHPVTGREGVTLRITPRKPAAREEQPILAVKLRSRPVDATPAVAPAIAQAVAPPPTPAPQLVAGSRAGTPAAPMAPREPVPAPALSPLSRFLRRNPAPAAPVRDIRNAIAAARNAEQSIGGVQTVEADGPSDAPVNGLTLAGILLPRLKSGDSRLESWSIDLGRLSGKAAGQAVIGAASGGTVIRTMHDGRWEDVDQPATIAGWSIQPPPPGLEDDHLGLLLPPLGWASPRIPLPDGVTLLYGRRDGTAGILSMDMLVAPAATLRLSDGSTAPLDSWRHHRHHLSLSRSGDQLATTMAMGAKNAVRLLDADLTGLGKLESATNRSGQLLRGQHLAVGVHLLRFD